MVRTKPFLKSIIIIFIFIHCGIFPTKSSDKEPKFNIDIQYTGEGSSGGEYLLLGKHNVKQSREFQKPDSEQSIDMVRVMVLDFSKWKDMQEFWVSEEYTQFENSITDTTFQWNYWSEWEKILSRSFSIASNQTVDVVGDTARGSVTGVTGLNYFIVAMLNEGIIKYTGEEHARGEEGKTETIHIEMTSWEDLYNYL